MLPDFSQMVIKPNLLKELEICRNQILAKIAVDITNSEKSLNSKIDKVINNEDSINSKIKTVISETRDLFNGIEIKIGKIETELKEDI